MHIRPVKAYKMNEDFKILPKLMYTGEYDDNRHLINRSLAKVVIAS